MKSSIVLAAFAVLLIASGAVAAPLWYSITGTAPNYHIQAGQVTSAVAQAHYDSASIQTTGWATLGLYSKAVNGASNEHKANAAGFLEGASLSLNLPYFTLPTPSIHLLRGMRWRHASLVVNNSRLY